MARLVNSYKALCSSYDNGTYKNITGVIVQATQVEVHPNFRQSNAPYYQNHKYNNYAYDYCLVKFNRIDLDAINAGLPQPTKVKIETVILAEQHPPFAVGMPAENSSNTVCWIAGWGKMSNGKQSPVLREATVNLMSKTYCNALSKNITGYRARKVKRVYSRVTGDYSFCSGQTGAGADTCKGDSGGPLFCRTNEKWLLVGVTSHGPTTGDCGRAGRPGIYAKVSHILPWIKATTDCK